MISIEQKILACAAGLSTGSHQQRRLRRLMSQGMDAASLTDLAINESLTGFLYKSLVESDALHHLTHAEIECIRFLHQRTVFLNMKLMHDCHVLLHQLNEKGIKVVLLKGISLLHRVYEDIGLRPMMDIDLWVPRDNYPALISILSMQGYRRDPLYPNTFTRGATIIDLHTHILGAERIKARERLFSRSQDHFFHDAISITVAGEEAWCLTEYDQVIYLSLHALKHNVDRLIWLVDIARIIANWGTPQWQALIDRSRFMGQERSVSYILFLIRRLLGVSFPPHVTSELHLEGLSVLERRLLRKRLNSRSLPLWAPLFLFSPDRGLRERIYSITETLFPKPAILRQVFVSPRTLKVWELYLKRVHQLITMIGKV